MPECIPDIFFWRSLMDRFESILGEAGTTLEELRQVVKGETPPEPPDGVTGKAIDPARQMFDKTEVLIEYTESLSETVPRRGKHWTELPSITGTSTPIFRRRRCSQCLERSLRQPDGALDALLSEGQARQG